MPGIGKRAWEYLYPGTKIGGLTIAAVMHPGQTKDDTRYLVVFDCCCGEREMTHRGIDKRVDRGGGQCNQCTRRRIATEMGVRRIGKHNAERRPAEPEPELVVVVESGMWRGKYRMLGRMGR